MAAAKADILVQADDLLKNGTRYVDLYEPLYTQLFTSIALPIGCSILVDVWYKPKRILLLFGLFSTFIILSVLGVPLF